MIYMIHRNGRGVTSAVSQREAKAYSEMHGIPKSHWFFYHPEQNPFIQVVDGVYHYKHESMNLEENND